MKTLTFDEQTLAQARRFNRRLAWAPRFKVTQRVTRDVIQALLQLSQLGGNRRLARQGLQVERRMATLDGQQVPVRIIRPAGAVIGVVFDVHGGGWAVGNAQMDDVQNVAMANDCQVAVVSVDYRLFGNTPLSGLLDDVLTAARWLLSNGLPEYCGLPVVMVGESAGGHLVAATLLQLKAWPALLQRVCGAVLYYGVYDLAGTARVQRAGPQTLLLDGPRMVSAMQMLTPCMNDLERRQPPHSPLYGDLAELPPALMLVGTLDPLKDDTTELAARWSQCATVDAYLVPEAPHGFIHFRTRMAEQVLALSRQWIRDRLAQRPSA